MASSFNFISGVANSPSWLFQTADSGGHLDMVAAGAWTGVDLTSPLITCCLHHDESQRIGSVADGSLRLWIEHGELWFDCDIPRTDIGTQARADIQAGRIGGSSASFIVGESHWRVIDGVHCRIITKIHSLLHVSPVSQGFCPQTSVSLNERRTFPKVAPANKPAAAVTTPKTLQASSRQSALAAGGKRPKQLMSCGPIPNGIANAYRLMNAASAGLGLSIHGRVFSAGSVEALVDSVGPGKVSNTAGPVIL